MFLKSDFLFDFIRYEGPALEVWALGVTLYTLVYGENPFRDIDETIEGKLMPPHFLSPGTLHLLPCAFSSLQNLQPFQYFEKFCPCFHLYFYKNPAGPSKLKAPMSILPESRFERRWWGDCEYPSVKTTC